VAKQNMVQCWKTEKLQMVTSLGALVVTHAMLRRLTSWRCIIIIIIGRKLKILAKLTFAPNVPM